jgi:FAD/FMN-containing dehydrogenase
VVAAVKFARAHNLRLVVKGGGHSYQGTSNGPDSLLIWTRAMNQVTVHDRFVAQGCEGLQAPTPAVTVGAGAMWIDAYQAVTTQAGRYVQGGGCTTVGVAGHIQSGGFGSMSKRFGTAAGGLLEAEVVTADGVLRTVNPRRDPELFWAIKGGGGGSLGVVTKVTVRTHDLPQNFGGVGFRVQAKSDDAFRQLIGRFVSLYADQLLGPHWGESATFRSSNRLDVSMVNQGLTDDEVEAIWRPFLDWIAAAPLDFSLSRAPDMGVGPARAWWDAEARRRRGSTSMKFDERPGAPAYHAWWSGDGDQVSAFLYGYDSVWLPERLLAAPERERLADALFAASRPMSVALHFNKGLAGAPPEAIAAARDTAMNPDVLSAFALAIIATGGPPAYPGMPSPPQDYGRKEAAKVAEASAILRRVAPGAGSYLAESDYFNPDWRAAFWGENYPRLKAAKAKYDPHGLFIVHHGVGSEHWSPDGFTRLT